MFVGECIFIDYNWNLIGCFWSVGFNLNKAHYFISNQFQERQSMNESQAQLTSIYQEMARFFSRQCRSEKQQYQPLLFRINYNNSLKVIDSEKHPFPVDEAFLNNYKTLYSDKNYKYVKLHGWEFQIEFFGKKCVKIYMISSKISFSPAKGPAREIDGCHFKVTIVQNQTEAKNLTPEILGYLNRLGKRNIIKDSENVSKQHKSLLNFAKRAPRKVELFSYKPYVKPDGQQKNPLQLINNEGKAVVQKMRHFITAEELSSFIDDIEISDYTDKRLKKLLTDMEIDE